ncbi:MAG: undecaprenyldiphospho-muramoylpentapeptide beta-N-acetylglucosaminyltransferase, partial [Planctomycetota bacterium]|nr:undecaprenyldiphospho-muramoylpentapeptide beta-N-acetylglucosaminyltransferase [Planctomycetota bacterium]
GGGTGGHLFPGMAVAEELRRRAADVAIEFWGTERELERRILAEHGWTHRCLSGEPSTSLRRHPLRVMSGNWQAYRQSHRWLKQHPPSTVIGLGGFSSAPVVYAAQRLGIPIVLLEQNTIPGRATRYLCRWADVVCTSFPETQSFLRNGCRVELTGNPISSEIANLTTDSPSLPSRLLILGGSQGAAAINQAMIAAIPLLKPHLKDWHIVHQTGAADVDQVRAAYRQHDIAARVEAFLSPMSLAYAEAGCVVSRAGATTLAELACCGIPAILVPYPHAVNQHQLRNAEFFRDNHAAILVEQRDEASNFPNRLADRLIPLLTDESQRRKMNRSMRQLASPDAAANVADLVVQLAKSSKH